MQVTGLKIHDLLEPQVLAGLVFPESINQYLSLLDVVTLHTTHDEAGIVYSGRLAFSLLGKPPVHVTAAGVRWGFEVLTVGFRLTLPRDGNQLLQNLVQLPDPLDPFNPSAFLLPGLDSLFNDFGAVEQTPAVATEYPGTRFRLELLADVMSVELPDMWIPGRLDANHHIVPDELFSGRPVRILLPKILLEFTLTEDLAAGIQFRPRAWGNVGFDAPTDLAAGEFIRMEPPIALHESGEFAMSVDRLQLDLSEDHTPPEILEYFGADESWQGLYIRHFRLYVNDKGLGLGFNFAVNDALLSWHQGVQTSFEASLDVFTNIGGGMRITVRFVDGGEDRTESARKATDGRIDVNPTAVVYVDPGSGIPPHSITVTLNGENIWNNDLRHARISPQSPDSPRPAGDYTLVVTVTDAENREAEKSFLIRVTGEPQPIPPTEEDGSPADRPATPKLAPAVMTISSPAISDIPDGYVPKHVPRNSSIWEEIELGQSEVQVDIDGMTVEKEGSVLTIPVAAGEAHELTLTYPAAATARLYFAINQPRAADDPYNRPASPTEYAQGNEPPDSNFRSGTTSPAGEPGLSGPQGLRNWLNRNQVTALSVEGHASLEDLPSSGDDALSARRTEVVRRVTKDHNEAIEVTENPRGHSAAEEATPKRYNDERDRVAIITADSFSPASAITIVIRIERGSTPVTPPPDEGNPLPTRGPDVIKRLGCRIRVERNYPVLLELSAQIDFETKLETTVREEQIAAGNSDGTGELPTPTTPSGQPHPADGVVDATILITFDTATKELIHTYTIGASEGDIDGLWQLPNTRNAQNPDAQRNFAVDLLGNLMVLAPVINEAADNVNVPPLDAELAGDVAFLGLSIALPVTATVADIMQVDSIMLFGVQVERREIINIYQLVEDLDIQNPSVDDLNLDRLDYRFVGFGVLFDYGVKFRIVIDKLGIDARLPLMVRYRAVGFFLHTNIDVRVGTNGVDSSLTDPGDSLSRIHYQPIFDTSKGFDLELTDPAVISLPSPLGAMLEVFAASVSRINPVTIELDLALTIDCGLAVGGRFLVKAPLDGETLPTIMPSLLYLKIPGVVEATGYINIVNTVQDGVVQKGIEGMLDLSLTACQLRLTASVGVVLLQPENPPHDADLFERFAAAVYVGVSAEFPTPIPLWSSGVAIYGLSGLFAMHYNRLEGERGPGDSTSPALRWLIRSGGNPTRLVDAQGNRLWGVELSSWSAGIGVVLGTTVNEVLINFGGMLVFELPGPRVLIFVKVQMLTILPSLDDAELAVGVLGVIDLDLELGQLTLGVMISFSIERLIVVKVPVELFFKFNDLPDWHLHAGSISEPATADVLGIVRGRGYLMIRGKGITPFPPPDGEGLTGVAVAVGCEAAVTFGEGFVYAEVAASAHMGARISPLFITGKVSLRGTIHLTLASIGAYAELNLEAPDPTFIHGEICGKINLLLTTLEACIPIEFGNSERNLTASDLVQGVYLQSHSPVLTHGQASERPIDASLGNASRTDVPDLPTVPIDTVPVIQFAAPPVLATDVETFTEPLLLAPSQTTADGWIDVGAANQVRYTLRKLTLDPPLPTGTPLPPATWRVEADPAVADDVNHLDLALFSRVPFVASRAIERSTHLEELVEQRWQYVCTPAAPPTCVLWTFCEQPFGASANGWLLNGVALPDPDGTIRRSPVNKQLKVDPPLRSAEAALLEQLLVDASQPSTVPARIVGLNQFGGTSIIKDDMTCAFLKKLKPGRAANPLSSDGFQFLVHGKDNRPAKEAEIVLKGRTIGLRCDGGIDVSFPNATSVVEFVVLDSTGSTQVTAFDQRGKRIAEERMKAGSDKPVTLRLTAKQINGVRLTTANPDGLLIHVCRHNERRQVTRPPDNFACYRALQLPFLVDPNRSRRLELNARVLAALGDRATQQFVTLRTGRVTRAAMYLAVRPRALQTTVVRELNANHELLRETPLDDLSPAVVSSGLDSLPSDWRDQSLPWRELVAPVTMLFSDTRYAEYTQLVCEIEPLQETVSLQIVVEHGSPGRSDLLLGAVEVCPRAELERVEFQQALQTDELATPADYLGNAETVPLLQPDTRYTLSLDYEVESKAPDGTITQSSQSQSFHFQTDQAAPSRLQPYVLGTTPNHEAARHFVHDPCRLVFNDAAIDLLFAAYGKDLKIVVRAADAAPVRPAEPNDSFGTRPLSIPLADLLQTTPAQYRSPYRDALNDFVAGLSCVDVDDGAVHETATLPILLRPLMSYSIDVEVDPPDPLPEDDAIVPLFRFSFTTSRYATVAKFAEAVRTQRMNILAVDQPLTLPAPSDGNVAVVDEVTLQETLRSAGVDVVPDDSRPTLTMLWAPAGNASHYRPHVLMIDTPEAAWRFRVEPRLEVVPGAVGAPIDPAYQRIVERQIADMQIVPAASTGVSHFVRTASSRRTLVVLSPLNDPPVPQIQIRLVLHREGSELFGVSTETESLLDVTIDTTPPWETTP